MKDVAVPPDGISLCYETHGAGTPALLFVHGWSCDRSYWSGQLGYLAGRHQVVAIDLAGHGESEGVETVLMSGVGHFLMMEDPVTFNRLLGETLEGFMR